MHQRFVYSAGGSFKSLVKSDHLVKLKETRDTQYLYIYQNELDKTLSMIFFTTLTKSTGENGFLKVLPIETHAFISNLQYDGHQRWVGLIVYKFSGKRSRDLTIHKGKIIYLRIND